VTRAAQSSTRRIPEATLSRTGFDGDIETWRNISNARTEEVPR
jgi:hypothetical protein